MFNNILFKNQKNRHGRINDFKNYNDILGLRGKNEKLEVKR